MFKKIFKGILLLVFIVIVSLFIFVRLNKPTYKGEINLQHITDEVDIYFDEIGVPHIYAQNQKDAYVALGYVHAQDRLWQMELLRRISAGRLSEIFGEDLIKTDKFFKGLGIEIAAKELIEKLDKNSDAYILTLAYLDGINQFIENGVTPVEFRLIGVEKEKYTINDIYNVFGYMSFGFAQAHITDPLLTSIREKLGDAYLVDLGFNPNPNNTLIYNHNPDANLISSGVSNIMKNLPVSSFIGSNSWVIGAKKTKNKKVIFANDPHMAFAQPAVWYQNHIVTPQFEIYGFNLALTPFPLLGHNHNYAYGLTMFENDDIDFYKENKNSSFKTRKETIKVKDGEDVVFEVKESENGPIMNDLLDGITDENPISMNWIFSHYENKMLEASYRMSHAKSFSDFKKGTALIYAPGLNVMYGDADNNIAWFAAAKLYKHTNNVNSKFILDGTNGEDNKIEYLDFSQNPQAVNPPWNYVYSANNQPDSIAGMLYPGYYLPEDRAKRIVELLNPKNDFSLEDVKVMINDVQSAVVPEIIQETLKNLTQVSFTENEKKAVEILKNWDGTYNKNEIAPTIYNKYLFRLTYNTFADELGEEGFKQYLNTVLFLRQTAKQVKIRKSIWWDNMNTKNVKEDRDEIFTQSFHESISALEDQFGKDVNSWTWDKALSITHKHTFDKIGSLKNYFNVGPFKTVGGNEVINNHIFDINDSGKYEVNAGPSTRRVIDFSDVENSVAISPTGQSGNIFSKHYKDQAQKYLEGGFNKMKLNKNEIQKSKSKLVLKPKK